MKPAFLLLITALTLSAQSKEVTLVAPGGIRSAIEHLIPGFEAKTDIHVKPTFGSGLGTKKQVAAGEAFDVPVIQPPYPEVLASGNVVATSAKPLASVAVGVAVRKGAAKPDLSTPEAVKKALLGAKAVSYPDAAGGAAAGVSFVEMLKKMGIWEQMQPILKPAQGGAAAMKMVAEGKVDFGLTFLSEMEEPGIEAVGPLPKQICPPTSLVGFVSAHAKDPASAKALLDYLSSSAAASAYKEAKMQPGK